jgi:hypothetical protein
MYGVSSAKTGMMPKKLWFFGFDFVPLPDTWEKHHYLDLKFMLLVFFMNAADQMNGLYQGERFRKVLKFENQCGSR